MTFGIRILDMCRCASVARAHAVLSRAAYAGRAAEHRLIGERAATDIRLDQELRAAAEADAINLQVLEDALDVITRLRERNAFDPVDRIDAGVARIAVALHPFLHPAGPRVVAGERHDIGPAIALDHVAEL